MTRKYTSRQLSKVQADMLADIVSGARRTFDGRQRASIQHLSHLGLITYAADFTGPRQSLHWSITATATPAGCALIEEQKS